jgi:hypothetical protein
MTPLVRACALAGALLLTGCGSMAPSWDWVPSMSLGGSAGPAVSLTIESDPPGADAKTSLGPSCRTPCMVPVAASQPFTVSYALNGYLPQTIEVIPRAPEPTRFDPEVGPTASGPDLSPNPVFAQLQLAPPPPVSKKGRGRPKQVAKQPQFRQ